MEECKIPVEYVVISEIHSIFLFNMRMKHKYILQGADKKVSSLISIFIIHIKNYRKIK